MVAGGSQTVGQAQGITLVVNPLVVRLLLEGIVDLPAETQRLRDELDGCLKNLTRVETLVSNPDFRSKARARSSPERRRPAGGAEGPGAAPGGDPGPAGRVAPRGATGPDTSRLMDDISSFTGSCHPENK